MKQYVPYMIILACLIATFFLYNKQLASVPLLILSAFLFYYGVKEVINLKNPK